MNMSIDKQMNWNGTKLSKFPVVVYDAKSNPKYYEFIVKKQDGTPIGTITAAAKEEVGASVAYLLPYVRNYNFVSSKGAAYKMISDGYPNHILVGIPGKGGNSPTGVFDPATGQSVYADTVITEDAQGMIANLNNQPQEYFDSLKVSKADLIDGLKQKDLQNQQEANDYWTMVDTLNAAISNLSDDSIASIINTDKGFISYTHSDQFILPPYVKTPDLKATRWAGWCGPSTIAMIYRAYNPYYKGYYLPIASSLLAPFAYEYGGSLDKQWVRIQSNNIDNGLYADIAESSRMYADKGLLGGPGSTTFWDLSNALSNVSDGRMYVYPLPIISFLPVEVNSLNAGHRWLRNAKSPLLCVTDMVSHYQIAIGSEIDYWKWDFVFRFFGIHRIHLLSIPTSRWLLMMDDGYHMVAHGNRAYWKNDSWNLDVQFKIVRR